MYVHAPSCLCSCVPACTVYRCVYVCRLCSSLHVPPFHFILFMLFPAPWACRGARAQPPVNVRSSQLQCAYVYVCCCVIRPGLISKRRLATCSICSTWHHCSSSSDPDNPRVLSTASLMCACWHRTGLSEVASSRFACCNASCRWPKT